MAGVTVSMKVIGGAELDAALKLLSDDVAVKAQRGMLLKAGDVMKQEMVMRCPVGPTGNLANSIRASAHKRRDGRGLEVRVGPRAPHAHLIHMGHRTRVPRKGYGGRVQYWGSYWAKKMHGEFIKGGVLTAQPNPFVTVAAEKTFDESVNAAVDYLRGVVRKYEKRVYGTV